MATYSKINIKDSIATKLLKVVFSIYLFIAVAVTVIHMTAEYFTAKDNIVQDLKIFQKTFEEGLSQSLWEVNTDQLHRTLAGIAEVPVIVGVTIKSPDVGIVGTGVILNQEEKVVSINFKGDQFPVEGQKALSGLFRHKFEIIHTDDKGVKDNVGQGIFYSSTVVVFQRIKMGFLFIIINSFIKTAALWIIFLIAFRFYLSRPLTALTTATEQVDLDKLENVVVKVPTSGRNELKILEEAFNAMIQKLFISQKGRAELNKKLADYNKTLEQKVEARTKDLNISLNQVKDANEEIMQSIRYAEMIQRSMLPGLDIFKTNVPDSFVIWMPRDIVGGDIIYADFTNTGIVVALVDCTGHGVPGAFMSMIASSGLRKIISDEGCNDPAEILKRLNYFVKKSLQQDSKTAESDDGMDVAVCYFSKRDQAVTFAGAKQPLFIIDNEMINMINGDRQSIGYKKSDLEFNYTNHKINLKDGMSFYLTTDGFVDQFGGEKRRIFGKKRLKQVLLENHHKPYDSQRKALMKAHYDYRGDNDRQDDITLLGWSLTKYKQAVVLVATIAFSDSVSSSKSQILDTYLKNITPDVKKNDGYINKDTSNSFMIFFSNKADAAIATSIIMQERLRELSYNNEDVSISIGIYTCTLAVRSFKELETIDKEDIARQ